MTASGRLRPPSRPASPPPASPHPSPPPSPPPASQHVLKGMLAHDWGDVGTLARRAADVCWALLCAQMEVECLLYTLNERLKKVSQPWGTLLLCAFVLPVSALTFSTFFWIFTSGGDRWVINPVVSEFEFPLVPENALKVYSCCKYLVSMCIAYNYYKYITERKDKTVTLMNSLELEAIRAFGKERLDATVPRPQDDVRTREARELIAMRRLYWRGSFAFDVFPQPDPPPEPEATAEEVQLIREALELDAVKRLNDPKMLREYIRRRESRMARRKVSKSKSLRVTRIAARRSFTVDSQLNVIKEEDSLSQLSDQGIRHTEDENVCDYSRSESPVRSSPDRNAKAHPDGSQGIENKYPLDVCDGKKQRTLQAPKWPVSGTFRGRNSRPSSRGSEGERDGQYRVPPSSRPQTPRGPDRSSPRPSTGTEMWDHPSGDGERPRSAHNRDSSRSGSRSGSTSGSRSGSRSRGSSSGSERNEMGSGKRAKGPNSLRPIVWDSLSQIMTPATPAEPDLVVVPHEAGAIALSVCNALAAAAAAAERHQDSLEDLSCPSTTDEDGDLDQTFYSSGDSAFSITEDDLPEDGCDVTWDGGSDRARYDLEIADLMQPRAGWSDSKSSLSGLSPSLTAALANNERTSSGTLADA